LIEIRWHGRGGHGIVVASDLLGEMLLEKKLYTLSIPVFGAERRGAPVMVVTRINNRPIMKRSAESNPDIIIVTDRHLVDMVDVTNGLKKGGLVVINTDEFDEELSSIFKDFKVAYVNAVEISGKWGLKLSGLPLVNIPLLGALIKATNLVNPDVGERVLRKHWKGDLGEKNASVFREAYEVVKIVDES
jgi:2-oxoacid:acceptor oxidoreductase gamma subunit (pyruvate/2-ketoisovalerate family)